MEIFIGIDVSKKHLDIYIDGISKALKILNTLEEIQECIMQFSQDHTIKLAICEATGGYEHLIVQCFKAAGLPIHIVHANKVRYFAKTTGLLAKTDAIDARLLSLYARTFQPKPDTDDLTSDQLDMQCLIKRRQQIIKQRIEESNRLDKVLPQWMADSINNHIKFLNQEISTIDKRLNSMSQSSLYQPLTLLTSIPGIGLLTAATILSCVPEIGTGSASSLAALVGVAPFNNDSGKINKKRSIYAGRAPVRAALYMATVASIIHNPQIKAFYNKLKAKGKPSKVAIVACMRKLLLIVHAVIKRNTPWMNDKVMTTILS